MLIKLTGHRTDLPVLVESDAIIAAEETTDIYNNGGKFTRLILMAENNQTGVNVKETCDEILEEISDSAEGLL